MTLKKRYIQVADKKDYFLSCNFKWESQAHQSLRLRTFLFGSVTGCEKSTTGTTTNRYHTPIETRAVNSIYRLHEIATFARVVIRILYPKLHFLGSTSEFGVNTHRTYPSHCAFYARSHYGFQLYRMH